MTATAGATGAPNVLMRRRPRSGDVEGEEGGGGGT